MDFLLSYGNRFGVLIGNRFGVLIGNRFGSS